MQYRRGPLYVFVFANYRQRPPAVILAIEVLYLPPGFRSGVGHMPVAAKTRLQLQCDSPHLGLAADGKPSV